MKLQNLLCATALFGLATFASCKKDDDNNTTPASGNLGAGKAAVSFNTNINFAGSTTYNPSNPVQAVAVRQASGAGYDNISLIVNEVNTSTISSRNVQFTILLASSSSTANGTLNAKFSNSASDPIFPSLTITSTSGSTVGDGYTSESGDVAITKLTDTEIEGTFSGKLVNDDKGTSITVSNGKFAGRFK